MFNYIIIDDNKIDLLVATKAIELSKQAIASIHQFSGATAALEFIKSFQSNVHTIMLIDIQMPVMNGFEFIEAFEQLSDELKANYSCFFLTSSSNDLDRLRAQKYPSIKQFLSKPFKTETLASLIKTS